LILKDGKVFSAGEIEQTITSEKISEAFNLAITVDFVDGRYRARAQ
jgi:iron complex transport system ATP-binding protein